MGSNESGKEDYNYNALICDSLINAIDQMQEARDSMKETADILRAKEAQLEKRTESIKDTETKRQ